MSKVRVLSDILDANNDLDITRLKSSGVTAGSYGSAANVPVITIDAYGRITAAANTAVAGVSAVDYDTVTGIYTISTSAGTSYPKDLGIGTADSPSFTGLTVTNTITGNIDTSAKWATARTIALTGGVTGSQTIDGSGNVSIATTVTAGLAPLASPAFTGTPTAPTAAVTTNTTQLATTAFVRGEVTALVASAPGTLDTLNELAAALGDDANFSTTVTNSIATKLSLSGGTMTGNLNLGDNDKIQLGASQDLQIYHDASDSWINEVGTGTLIIGSNGSGVNIQKGTTETLAQFVTDGACNFYFDNSKKIETTSSGVNITGKLVVDEIQLLDSEKITLGNSSDLEIYHDGSHSYIKDVGAGNLYITGSNNVVIRDSAGTELANFAHAGVVDLYHNGNSKLATASSGVSVTGTLTASGNVTAYSDERLKDDIQVIPNALSKVEGIRGVTFTRNDLETDERFSGVIAQEVEAVLPEVIHESEDGMKTVDYGNMVGLLIEGMKEQQEIIRSLATRIEDLEGK